jgi:hypothetical protein
LETRIEKRQTQTDCTQVQTSHFKYTHASTETLDQTHTDDDVVGRAVVGNGGKRIAAVDGLSASLAGTPARNCFRPILIKQEEKIIKKLRPRKRRIHRGSDRVETFASTNVWVEITSAGRAGHKPMSPSRMGTDKTVSQDQRLHSQQGERRQDMQDDQKPLAKDHACRKEESQYG